MDFLTVSSSQNVSIASIVLEQYQNMIEDAKSDLNDQAESTIIADLVQETPHIQYIVAREKISIKQCHQICNRALEFTMTSDFQVPLGQPAVVSSINQLLPEEQRDSAVLRISQPLVL